MAQLLKSIFGIIYAEEDNVNITLRGVKTEVLSRDIMRTWSTSRIEGFMFTKFRYNVISFPKFFALDVHYILNQLLTGKYMRTSKNVIQKALAALEESTWLKQLKEDPPKIFDRTKISLFKKSPLPHQVGFFDIYEDRVPRYNLNGYLLSAAAGSGKTLTVLMSAEMLHADVVVLVVPKNALYTVWSNHLTNEYKQPQKHWIALEGKPYSGERFILTHYDALDKTLEVVKRINPSNAFVALDESHNFNESTSQRTALFVEMCRVLKAKNVIWSSGTPIKAMGYESIPLLRTIDPLFTADVEARFKKIFGKEAKRALDILKNRMGIISYRVEKTEVVDNKATTQNVKVKIPNGKDYTLDVVSKEMSDYIKTKLNDYLKNMKHYEAIYNAALAEHEKTLKTGEQKKAFDTYKDYIKTIRKSYDPYTMSALSKYCNEYELKTIMPSIAQNLRAEFKNCRAIIKYPQLKVMGEALGNVLGKKRVKCHIDLTNNSHLETYVEQAEKKTVIFTSYVEVVDSLNSYFKSKGYKPLIVYGETNKDLPAIVGQFGKDPQANPLIATYKSLSTAVPLIMADMAIFTNAPWRDYELTQAKARVDRLGQDTSVKFVFTTLDTGEEPNLSTRSSDILAWSREQIALIMGQQYSDEATSVINSTIGMESIDTSDEVNTLYQEYFN